MAAAPRLPTPLRLPLAVLAAAGRRAQRAWRDGALHHMAIGGPRTNGLAIRPRDLRPGDAARGVGLLQGQFRLANEGFDAGVGGSPWRRPLPSRAFATALHGFAWLPDLLTQGEPGAREALRLWLEWRRVFGRYNPFAWSDLALERRVFNLACAAPILAPLVSEAEGAAYVDGLARQARHLIGEPGDPGRAAERCTVAALVGASLADKAGASLRGAALARLSRRLDAAVMPDGVHASRAPERGLELLFDLLALDDALSQIGEAAPAAVSRAIDRLAAGVRLFALGDGRLARFHGGGAAERARVATALSLDAGEGEPAKAAPYGGYHRLAAAGLQAIVDAGSPPVGVWGAAGCAQPAALSVTCDGRRLVVGCGWSAALGAETVLRGPFGGSCLALDDVWPGAALHRGVLADGVGARLDGGPAVKAERHQAGDEAWLEIVHDGWPGFSCLRRIYVGGATSELRGEEVLTPHGRAGQGARGFVVRFILAPEVVGQVAMDARSVLLRPSGGRGWRLRSDVPISLERAAVFEDGEPRTTQALVLEGAIRAGEASRIRWKLAPDER